MRFCRVYKNCLTENDFLKTTIKYCDDLWFKNGKKTGVQKFFENCTFVQIWQKNCTILRFFHEKCLKNPKKILKNANKMLMTEIF